jgi:hypothetical protein
MARFFPNSIDRQIIGSRADLDAQRAQFRNGKLSGFLEVQSMPEEHELLLFSGGHEIANYRLWPNSRLKISSSDIGIGWDRQMVPIRYVALPDQASRSLWQALEFQLFSQKVIADQVEWKKFLESCHTARFTGSIEVISERSDGFVFLHEGVISPNESVFHSKDGFTSYIQDAEGCFTYPLKLTIYKVDPSTQAYQCILLRRGTISWGDQILVTYKDMAGQKLLSLLNANMNTLFLNKQVNIHLADIEIIDNHFFCEASSEAEAYRLFFQDLSELIGHVIGGMVTRRIMSYAFNRLGFGEQNILKTHTLAPDVLLN